MEQVYIFDFGDKIKVGYSTDVKKRQRTIEFSSGVAAKRVYVVNAGRNVERLLLGSLQNRLLGEFFAFPFEDAVRVLDGIVATQVNTGTRKKCESSAFVDGIKSIMKHENLSVTDVARLTKQSPQSLYNKIARNKLNSNDVEKITSALGYKVSFSFHFPDGTVI